GTFTAPTLSLGDNGGAVICVGVDGVNCQTIDRSVSYHGERRRTFSPDWFSSF
ncbi:hypothetical protein J3R82DRAFT_2159, partial [Butyriboletus roseoflavus]